MAVQTVTDIVQNILNQLQISDPSVSAEVGTPEREIIEATAEIIAASQVDFSVLDSQNDISTMTGGRLDSYLSLFGFQRQQPVAASGTVTFSCNAPAVSDIVIPVGTPVSATPTDPTLPSVTFVTTLTVTLPNGDTSVDAPVQASLPGTIGNVAANAVTGFAGLQVIIGITSISNAVAMSGGTDAEDDDAFRIRFTNSIFRNMAGTYDQFMALAVSQPNVTKAVTLGPISRYQEYVQVPLVDDAEQDTASGDDKNYDPGGSNWGHKRTSAASSIPYSKYTYATQYYLSNGTQFFRPDVDYVFNRKAIDPANAASSHRHFLASAVTAHQPNVTILGHGASVFPPGLSPGTVVLLEHAYISANSRNDLASGIVNAVDVFVNGKNEQTASSAALMPSSSHNLQSTNANAWTYQHPASTTVINFIRNISGRAAAVSNKVMPLYWQPVLSVPETLTIPHSNGTTYTLYGARFYDSNANEYYYDNPAGTYTAGQTTAGYPRIANYIQVYESNNYRGTIRARSGIEFRSSAGHVRKIDDTGNETFYSTDAGFVDNQFSGSLSYTYDANVSALQAIMEKNKQITTDVLVHAATTRYFTLYITVMYTPGATSSVVSASIESAVQAYFENQYFGATIQLSDIMQAVHNVPGVDNVRWTADVIPPSTVWQTGHAYTVGQIVRPTVANANGFIFICTTSGTSDSTEPTWTTDFTTTVVDNSARWVGYATSHRVQEVFVDGSAFATPVFFDYDFYLQDDELADVPTTSQVVIQTRAQNTWTK